MEQCTIFKLSGEVIHVRSKWQSNFEVKRLNFKVTRAEMWKSFLAHMFAKNA